MDPEVFILSYSAQKVVVSLYHEKEWNKIKEREKKKLSNRLECLNSLIPLDWINLGNIEHT